jgi:hypothetical protein
MDWGLVDEKLSGVGSPSKAFLESYDYDPRLLNWGKVSNYKFTDYVCRFSSS